MGFITRTKAGPIPRQKALPVVSDKTRQLLPNCKVNVRDAIFRENVLDSLKETKLFDDNRLARVLLHCADSLGGLDNPDRVANDGGGRA
jgi:hypothetical protein